MVLHRIEHLPEDILPRFAPMMLGIYHPRLLLITTPSYTFNARFTAPDAPPGTRRGYLDPTGRTDRIFRHDDHKFEWTVEEFTQWCEEVAQQWGYEVEVSGVGIASEKDPWDRDDQLGKASQVAAFRRIEGENLKQMRETKSKTAGVQDRSREGRHDLLATHQHKPSERGQQSEGLEAIGQSVLQKMREFREQSITVQELWSELCPNCGGWLQNLIAAVTNTDGVRLHRHEGESSSSWEVELEGFVHQEDTNSQEVCSEYQEYESGENSFGWPANEAWGQPVDSSTSSGWEGTWEPSNSGNWKSAEWDEPTVCVA